MNINNLSDDEVGKYSCSKYLKNQYENEIDRALINLENSRMSDYEKNKLKAIERNKNKPTKKVVMSVDEERDFYNESREFRAARRDQEEMMRED